MADLALMSATEAMAALQQGKVSSVELTQACLDRIEKYNSLVNAFIRIEADEALATAAQLDKERQSGKVRSPIHGLVLAHKDMFDRPGKVSTGGTKILRDRVATRTATVLQRFDEAGAVDLGGLNMSEFAAGPTGHNIHYGDCCNAFNPDYVSGGSSSGSGAAVAARLVFGALGSDTGGSIRLPAGMNGLCGLKATYGRISRHGAMARSWSLDHIGPLGRSARDVALMYQAVAGEDPCDPSTLGQPEVGAIDFESASIKGLRIGVPVEKDLETVDVEVQQALQASYRVLEQLGAKLVPVKLPDFRSIYFLAETIIKSEAASMHHDWLKERPQDYSANVRVRIEAGLAIPAAAYIDALRMRTHLTASFIRDTMGEVDVLLLPNMPITVPRRDEANPESLAAGEKVLALVGRITQFTRPISFLGLPSLTVPCGFDQKGLSIAFQIVGRPFAENTLLVAADQFQQVTDYHRQAPSLVSQSS